MNERSSSVRPFFLLSVTIVQSIGDVLSVLTCAIATEVAWLWWFVREYIHATISSSVILFDKTCIRYVSSSALLMCNVTCIVLLRVLGIDWLARYANCCYNIFPNRLCFLGRQLKVDGGCSHALPLLVAILVSVNMQNLTTFSFAVILPWPDGCCVSSLVGQNTIE